MLKNIFTFRFILIGILSIVLLAIAFRMPQIIIDWLVFWFIIIFWIWYYFWKNALDWWGNVPFVLFITMAWFMIFSGSMEFLLYFILLTFWYVLSETFFPQVFSSIVNQSRLVKSRIILLTLIYFFIIPGAALFLIGKIMSSIFS
jgi:hypothetical protein